MVWAILIIACVIVGLSLRCAFVAERNRRELYESYLDLKSDLTGLRNAVRVYSYEYDGSVVTDPSYRIFLRDIMFKTALEDKDKNNDTV